MLVGESGCGKTSIVNERIRSVCSGEVAEVLGLTVNANRLVLLLSERDYFPDFMHKCSSLQLN